MMFTVIGAKCIGIDAVPVSVEVDISLGIGIHLVGMADIAVKESLLRTMSALQAMGFRIPGRKIVINLAPADMHKKGSGYDLPIAIGIIAASGQVELHNAGRYIIMGELGLDATLRPVAGALPIVDLAIKEGLSCILPEESAKEAMDCRSINVYGVRDMAEVLRILADKEDVSDLLVWNREGASGRQPASVTASRPSDYMDFSEIVGQEGAKRAMEIAAAGSHNVIMIGSPGSGKSSLAKALTGILPPMDREEALVTRKIYSVAGQGYGVMKDRPFRAPHYSVSMAGIIGGGNGDNILPGEVSLAESGVLFLDEFAQLPKNIAEALRGPLEDRRVTISRLRAKVTFPASFMLVAATNPCPCGYYGEGNRCTCTLSQRQGYLAKLSGPILDRIDVQLWLHPVESSKLVNAARAETSADVARRVAAARAVQRERFAHEGIFTNSEMSNRQMEYFCPLSRECRDVMEKIIGRAGLSARAFSRIVKLGRTIADLEGCGNIETRHLLEASGYRLLDRQR